MVWTENSHTDLSLLTVVHVTNLLSVVAPGCCPCIVIEITGRGCNVKYALKINYTSIFGKESHCWTLLCTCMNLCID